MGAKCRNQIPIFAAMKKTSKQARAMFNFVTEKDQHVEWDPKDKHIILNGRFTIRELEAIIAYVKGDTDGHT